MLIDKYKYKKLNIKNCKGWRHHRSGWNACINGLNLLYNEKGILVIDSIEQLINRNIKINEPWIGFSHNAICHNDFIKKNYDKYGNSDLQNIVNTELWETNIKNCFGLFSMCSINTNYLNKYITTETVKHISGSCNVKFDMNEFIENKNKKVYMIGHWMRNFEYFYKLISPYKKIILQDNLNYFKYNNVFKFKNKSVFYEQRLENYFYDKLFVNNIIFLNLFDCVACNTILECIERKTPILINKLFCCEEYLGKNYPFFYETLEEASEKLHDIDLIEKTHIYLKKINLSLEDFVDTIYNSKIYKKIC